MANPIRIDPNVGTIEMTDDEFKARLEAAGISGGATISDTAPADPTEGQYWYNTTDSKFYTWDGTEWIILTD